QPLLVGRDHMRVIENAEPDPVPAVMGELPAGTEGQDPVSHPATHLRTGGAGSELGGGRLEDPVELLVDVRYLGVVPADVRAASVGPVAVSAHADVSDHRLAGLRAGTSRDGDGAADLRGVRPGEEIGGELD